MVPCKPALPEGNNGVESISLVLKREASGECTRGSGVKSARFGIAFGDNSVNRNRMITTVMVGYELHKKRTGLRLGFGLGLLARVIIVGTVVEQRSRAELAVAGGLVVIGVRNHSVE